MIFSNLTSVFWRCWCSPNLKVVPETRETPIPKPEKFPLLTLREELVDNVLEFMTPLELISFSLCSKSTKQLAKAVRNQPKFKKDCKSFKVSFCPLFQRIVMEIKGFPNTHWQFLQDYGETDRIRDPKTRVLNSISIRNWKPKKQKANLYGSSPEYSDHEPAVFYSIETFSDYFPFGMNKLLDHINDVYNFPNRVMSVNLNSSYADRLMAFYKDKDPLEYWVLECTGLLSDILIKSAFDKQNASKGLFLRCENLSRTFRFDLESFNNVKENLDIYFAKWVKIEDIFNLKTERIAIFGSKLEDGDLRLLINKWREGWNPEWKQFLLEYNQYKVNPDRYFDEDCVEITNGRHKSFIVEDSPVKLFKFKEQKQLRNRNDTVYGYHILRDDGGIATLQIERSFGVFIIQSKNESCFQFSSHRCLFEPRVMWQ
ncbi:hypothetical protein CAEBREN_14501 [Caenorhabditis brenneri]|uniref:F-box domain-containing protein n=1 Tax=Caenorhabditis brenneri TaxID=135651 RepID=G0NMD9_CAEBE|nr:hypothetical protein CAEBREN_14501 [Caenorhabditis brenneri]